MLKCLVGDPKVDQEEEEKGVFGVVVEERFDLSKAMGWEALLVALVLHTKEDNVGREEMSVI